MKDRSILTEIYLEVSKTLQDIHKEIKDFSPEPFGKIKRSKPLNKPVNQLNMPPFNEILEE